MKFSKTIIAFFLISMMSFPLFSQNNQRTIRVKDGNRAPINYNINATLGGDNVPASLKIEIVADNLQVHRNTGSNSWSYQWFDWSDHPGRGVHIYIDGSYYYVNNSTDIYVDGVPAGSSLSYYEDSYGIPFDRLDITRIDDYNATLKFIRINYLEAFLTINYPPESDYINFTWELKNISNSAMNDLRFFQGGDTYSYGSDFGYGYWDAPRNTVGCQKEDNGQTVSVFLQSIEIPYQHESANWGFYSGVESHVMDNALTGEVITNTSHDNAIALEWRQASLGVDETWEIHTIEKYSDKEITNLVVIAPLNEVIYQGETKYLTFDVKNYSAETVTDITLDKIIDLPDWTVNIVNPTTTFDLLSLEEIDVTIQVVCPTDEIPGTIAKLTLEANADDETADDKAYIEVLSLLPIFTNQPENQDICNESEPVSFTTLGENVLGYQWQKLIGETWTVVIDDGIFSGASTNTLNISNSTDLIGIYFRCMMANNSGDVYSDSVRIIDDNSPPVADAISLPDVTGQCQVDGIAPPTATDACDGSIIGVTETEFPVVKDSTIVWTFTDSKGNISYIIQDIIISDLTPPVPDLDDLPDVNGECSTTVSTIPTATDNCSGQVFGTTTDPLTYNELGSYLITWTYEDNNENTITQNQTINVIDTKPNVETKDTTIIMSSESTETITITPEDINNGSFDECGIDSMYLDINTFTVADVGENLVHLTVVDIAGQDASKSAIVTIILDYELQIPNFVSPDNDGVNDYWKIIGLEKLEGYTLNIFNKLGEVIYHTENYDNTWNATYNGKELPDGTYYYVFKSIDNSYNGYISVIR